MWKFLGIFNDIRSFNGLRTCHGTFMDITDLLFKLLSHHNIPSFHIKCLFRHFRSQGGQKKRYKDTLKASLKDFNIPIDSWEQVVRIEQSGVASSTKVPPNLKKRESVKLKGSVKKGKQEPKNHHQSQHSPNSHVLFATDSLELKLAYTAINEHTTHINAKYSGIKMVFLSNERRTIIASIGRGNEKLCFLFQSEKNSGCYGNL